MKMSCHLSEESRDWAGLWNFRNEEYMIFHFLSFSLQDLLKVLSLFSSASRNISLATLKKKKGLNYVSFINQVEKEGLSGASMDNEPIPDHSLWQKKQGPEVNDSLLLGHILTSIARILSIQLRTTWKWK